MRTRTSATWTSVMAHQFQILTPPPLFVKMAQNLDLRCVLISDPSTQGAGAKTCLESKHKDVYATLGLQAEDLARLGICFLFWVPTKHTAIKLIVLYA